MIDWDAVRDGLAQFRRLVNRRDRHKDRLAAADVRVSVSGTRGKSSVTEMLHRALYERGYDTYGKVTGVEPKSLYNDEVNPIDRDGRVTLYENEREIRRYFPMDAIVLENHAITEYTTRLVNDRYLDPHVVVLTNVRRDHLDTMGENLERIARSLARSVPGGTHVVSGEQTSEVRRYLERELHKRDATVTHVDIPSEHESVPGAENAYCVDETLKALGERELSSEWIRSYVDELRPSWTELPGGRVYDASPVNDVESTEVVRESLAGDEVIQPLLYLRHDRPGRTATYADYLNDLAEGGAIEQVRVVDGHQRALDHQTSIPVVRHDPDEDPAAVLDAAFDDGWPVMLMGNTVPVFMDELTAIIEHRASAAGTDVDTVEEYSPEMWEAEG